jgi:hypothetical protein
MFQWLTKKSKNASIQGDTEFWVRICAAANQGAGPLSIEEMPAITMEQKIEKIAPKV